MLENIAHGTANGNVLALLLSQVHSIQFAQQYASIRQEGGKDNVMRLIFNSLNNPEKDYPAFKKSFSGTTVMRNRLLEAYRTVSALTWTALSSPIKYLLYSWDRWC
jgi:hypothetical protein